MAHILRPVIRWPRWQHSRCLRAALHDLLRSSSEIAADTPGIQRPSLAAAYSSKRDIHFRSRGLRLPNAPAPSDFRETESDDSDPDAKKSRNQKKREARRCVRWGMELASFSSPQIKRILKAASLERDVYDAIMLVKRLGRDVREGKRRQFNYIGRLLREVEPELMDGLIEATKDGDQSKFQALSGLENWVVGDDEEEVEEAYYDDEDEGSNNYIDVANRWFDGLINKDVNVTKEIYSVQDVDFDRQVQVVEKLIYKKSKGKVAYEKTLSLLLQSGTLCTRDTLFCSR
ncbi:uncharacterized protein LOC127808310 isoform X2 [Diospyros lotus]|uniref:uncharacterized protein LOC127808310 isoform X2 n=1 Tax=Diospyros lotus TaxID=55363 RepID=UPI00224D241E|nr:uncharacterized protein LOC127808310 isoform X2 [Diospyros lotus]